MCQRYNTVVTKLRNKAAIVHLLSEVDEYVVCVDQCIQSLSMLSLCAVDNGQKPTVCGFLKCSWLTMLSMDG